MRDRQRVQVYAWEDTWSGAGRRSLALSGVRKWVRWACGQYGIKPPAVRGHFRVRGGTSFYEPNDHTIEFRKRHFNMWVALHEAAHAICDVLLDIEEPHSPEWLGIFLSLLEKADYAPRVALLASANAAGLKFVPSSKIGPRRIRVNCPRAARQKRNYKF